MFFIRILIIVLVLSTLFQTHTFAASGTSSSSTVIGRSTSATGNTISRSKIISLDIDTETGSILEERKVEEKKTEKNAQKIILDVYKIQGNKILKDMDANIEKMNSDPKIRIDVYSGIQKTLELRKQKVEKSDMSDESKDILTSYIEYMISNIEKRKKNLE